MPELPEVERVRRELTDCLLGRVVHGVEVRRRDVVVMPGDPAGGFSRQRRAGSASQPAREPPTPKRLRPGLLGRGQAITGVDRHGKSLGLLFESAAVGVHLGMTGMLRVLGAGQRLTDADRAHAHVVWTLRTASGRPAGRLVFIDPRRFGGVWGFASGEDFAAHRRARTGPDALDLRGDRARAVIAALRSTARPLKAALLDQRLLAGVGNIYADEALHRAGLHPGRRGDSLDGPQARALLAGVRTVLRDAIDRGGSTIRDYRGTTGTPGDAQRHHAVYGRAGQACRRCGVTLVSGVLGGRTTVWCPACQA